MVLICSKHCIVANPFCQNEMKVNISGIKSQWKTWPYQFRCANLMKHETSECAHIMDMEWRMPSRTMSSYFNMISLLKMHNFTI